MVLCFMNRNRSTLITVIAACQKCVNKKVKSLESFNQFFIISSTMNIAVFLFLSVFCAGTEAVYYHFTEIENCTSSDIDFAVFETCVASKKTGMNITFEVKQLVNKISVINSKITEFCE